MAKQDWKAGEKATVSEMSRPYFIASGVYNGGASQLELQIGPGRIGYPMLPTPCYSGQPQQLIIDNPDADTYYNVYLRSDGSFMVSGYDNETGEPQSPRWDAEPIGRVYTGASLATANLKGPWNSAEFENWDLRSEAPARQASRPRMIHRTYNSSSGDALPNGVINYNTNFAAASGIAWLSFDAEYGKNMLDDSVYIAATISWVPSGAFPAGESDLYVAPVFNIRPSDNGTVGLPKGVQARAVERLTVPPNPDDMSTRGAFQKFATTLVTPIAGDGSTAANEGFSLGVYFDANAGDDAAAPTIRITDYVICCIPGLYGEDTKEGD